MLFRCMNVLYRVSFMGYVISVVRQGFMFRRVCFQFNNFIIEFEFRKGSLTERCSMCWGFGVSVQSDFIFYYFFGIGFQLIVFYFEILVFIFRFYLVIFVVLCFVGGLGEGIERVRIVFCSILGRVWWQLFLYYVGSLQ